GWNISNCDDIVSSSGNGSNRFYHSKCYRIQNTARTLKEFESCFKLAGFSEVLFNPIPNEYWRNSQDEHWVTPWYRVETPFGDIRIGWRKRVVEIDWSAIGSFDLGITDNVTKGDTYIHAWNLADVVKYLSA